MNLLRIFVFQLKIEYFKFNLMFDINIIDFIYSIVKIKLF